MHYLSLNSAKPQKNLRSRKFRNENVNNISVDIPYVKVYGRI